MNYYEKYVEYLKDSEEVNHNPFVQFFDNSDLMEKIKRVWGVEELEGEEYDIIVELFKGGFNSGFELGLMLGFYQSIKQAGLGIQESKKLVSFSILKGFYKNNAKTNIEAAEQVEQVM